MNLSYRWLREIAPGIDADPGTAAERLAMYGAPVEEVVRLDEGLREIVVGRVVEVRRHPNADRLTLCRVEAGGAAVEVVCGAPNVASGRLYPFAPVGARLPDGTKIRRVRIRGAESVGMLCSERELGLGPDHQGILELPDGLEPGRPLAEALGLDDVRLVVEVTANRPDLLSHVGIARELAPEGVEGVRLPPLPGSVPLELSPERGEREAAVAGVPVRIEDPDLCPRYMAAVIRNVRVGPSPGWLAARLRAVGARPINNVVDATNYVLYELGQPLHAFDLRRLRGPAVVVRRARDGESLVTLDGELRVLASTHLAICDAGGPVAVAGVMGGRDSEVTPETTDVLLECALFDPRSIRGTARDLGFATEASYRFERGVDPAGLPAALERAVALIRALAGGEAEPAAADVNPRVWTPPVVTLRPSRVSHVLGVPFDGEEVAGLLRPLGFRVEPGEGESLRVTVPGYRSYDVAREVDLVEEVARRYGYDRFPETLEPFRPGTVPDDPAFEVEDAVRRALVAEGLLEARVGSFVRAGEGEVALRNPVSSEETHLRGSLLPGLLRRVEHNLARGVRDVRLFEVGTVFLSPEREGEPPREETHVAVVLTGRREPLHWSGPGEDVDLWELKGILVRLLAPARLPSPELEPEPPASPLFRAGEGFTVRAGGTPVGGGGRIREGAVDAPPWAGSVWGLELALPREPGEVRPPVFRPLPAFPAVERDLALVVPDRIPAEEVARALAGAGAPLLEEAFLFDLFRGGRLPAGTRSLAYRLRFRSPERTLTDEDVEEVLARILSHLKEALGVEPRGP